MDLYNDYRLNVAQNLTRNSVVNRIGDLLAWYETSLPSSFRADEANVNNGNISIWFDNNTLSTRKNNATAQTPLSTANQPILVKNVFNGSIPALRFSGAQYLNFDGTGLAQTNYTIFVVEMRRIAGTNYFIGGSVMGDNQNLVIGYRSDTIMTLAHWNNDMDFASESYTSPISKIHRFFFNTSTGKAYALNGSAVAGTFLGGNATTNLQPLTSFNNARIGRAFAPYFNGDIAEIIIFRKDLNISQIKEVEAYLGKKYGIGIK